MFGLSYLFGAWNQTAEASKRDNFEGHLPVQILFASSITASRTLKPYLRMKVFIERHLLICEQRAGKGLPNVCKEVEGHGLTA